MKKLLFLLVATCYLFSGCKKDTLPDDFVYREYPSLSPSDLNLRDDQKNTLIVINDQRAFEAIFTYPERLMPVDFDKYTLLLVAGTENTPFKTIYSEVIREDNGQYRVKLSILFGGNYWTVVTPYQRAFVIPKTRAEDVSLEIDRYQQI
ncbi:MAG: hypothetical protein LBM20_07095 [Rikenellaceae bacterium]|jgi:hypothetical protein|nr:hypothetical protein [Rikenellaceae bacterium]